MGALPQPRPANPVKKPPAVETKRDKYGRDPESPCERLRGQSDLAADTGYAPLYHAALADLPRLASGAAFFAIVLHVNRLSYGRGKDAKGKRYDSTLPISAQAMADLCCCNVRQIQREFTDMKDRGVIALKSIRKGGAVEYVISLRYQDWRELEDYSAWKRRQVVMIDDGPEDEAETDEELTPISKEAVRLTKRAETVRPGRATRPKPVKVGVRSFKVQNTGGIDVAHEAVIQSGCLVVSFASEVAKGEDKTNAERRARRAGTLNPSESDGDLPDTATAHTITEKGEDKANAERRARRAGQISPLESTSENTKRTREIATLFDPLLQKSGARLLSPDKQALQSALSELGAMPAEFLEDFMLHPKKGRAARSISGPRAVASIIREARQNWEQQEANFAARSVQPERPLTMDEMIEAAKARRRDG